MKNTIDPKKAIAIISAVSVLIVGGYILGHHIIGEKENGEVAAANSPCPPVESTYVYEIDTLPDGIVGKDTMTSTPTPSVNPEDTTPTPDVKASAAPTPAAGSAGSVTAPVSTPSPAANSGSSSTGSTPAAGSTNSSGEVYVPGFGYVTPSTSGNQCIPSGSDGDWNKQVGTMG